MDGLLYCRPGDETLEDSPATVYESWECDWIDEDEPLPEPLEIEEWSSRPLADALREGWRIAEWLGEWLCDEAWEDAADAIDRASQDEEVIAAFDAARAVMASKLTA